MRTIYIQACVALILFMLLPLHPACAEEEGEEKRFSIEYEIDSHYSNVGIYASLTDKPIPEAGEIGEFEVYRRLVFGSLVPRFVVLEAAVFPVPVLGVILKKNSRGFYDDMELSGDFHVIKAVTAGFEEPYALSLFLGNVIRFKRRGEDFKKGNFGYSGYLISVGDKHLKDNDQIDDNWTELEWKIKGDREFSTHKLHWSFRLGAKLRGNPEIKDVFYVGLRRSRLGFEESSASILDNVGFEYRYDMDRHDFSAIRHYVMVDKKWPWKGKKMGVAIVLGFIWEGAEKYTGSLNDSSERDEFQFILRPNVHF
ncbi:MAG: hypothetical protein ACE5GF_03420 [Thermodesulfobacteriota bacterium]